VTSSTSSSKVSMRPVMANAHKECRGQIEGCDAGKCRTYDVYLDTLLGRLSRALGQQPRTRRPSRKHRESSTPELAAQHGLRDAFVSRRVWLLWLILMAYTRYKSTGRRCYLPETPSMHVASTIKSIRYRSTGSSDRSI
jgi:hypothetical protein